MVYLNDCGIVCALGQSHQTIPDRLLRSETGVQLTDVWSPGRMLPLGILPQPDCLPSLDAYEIRLHSRNNQIMLAALAQIRPAVDEAIGRYGAERIGVVLGTSTSGSSGTESAMRHYREQGTLPASFHYAQQEMASPASMLSVVLKTLGPAYVHSSACSSSAKALASAARLIKMGLCDAVVCGGVDSLCEFTVSGFSALESVSSAVCNPLSANRNGINIGEGAALFLMTREGASGGDSDSDIALFGWGESSDGHHMSAPDPGGRGARLAISQAMQRAGVRPEQIDYINLHGTATIHNDAMESQVIHDLFGPDVPVSSTKPLTGHALGAASAIEAGLCWLVMQEQNSEGRLPPHQWDGQQDPALPQLNVARVETRLKRPIQWALSNSFAFGGSNAALLFGRATNRSFHG
jgi:3-oxoacyl-[acyl-carrier-protein] synthase-1